MTDLYSQHVESCPTCRWSDDFCPTGMQLLTGKAPWTIISMEHDNIVYEVAAEAQKQLEEHVAGLYSEMSLGTFSKATTAEKYSSIYGPSPEKSLAGMAEQMKQWKASILGAFQLKDEDLKPEALYGPKLLPYSDSDVTACNQYLKTHAKNINFGKPFGNPPYVSPTGRKLETPKFKSFDSGATIKIIGTPKPFMPMHYMDYSAVEKKVASVYCTAADESHCVLCAAGLPKKPTTPTKPAATGWKATLLGALVTQMLLETP